MNSIDFLNLVCTRCCMVFGKKYLFQSLKMFLSFVLVLFVFSFTGKSLCESAALNGTGHYGIWNCQKGQTECLLGCCPVEGGSCCWDGYNCCPKGQKCIPVLGICMRLLENDGDTSLVSEKPIRVISSVFSCPDGMIECGPDRCCFETNNVPCPDNEHSCPKGYKCDVPNLRCIIPAEFKSSKGGFDKPIARMSKKKHFTTCPGKLVNCPSYMSCCLKDNDEWGCCPNPEFPEIEYGYGECCTSSFGDICCPNEAPFCTFFGCRGAEKTREKLVAGSAVH